MTLVELQYVVTLAQTRHFGRAAALCCVNQPTLSMAIRKLEEQLGVVLFERSKKGIKATDIGEQIIAQAQKIIAQTDAITALAAADKQQLCGTLTLGSIFTFGPYVLPQIMMQLRLIASQIQLHTYEGYPADLRQKLRAGELDAILISHSFSEPDILTQEVYVEPMLVALPPNHALAAKKIITAEDLHEQTFLLLNEKQCLREQMLAAYQPCEKNILECSSLETLRHMISMGFGISILPASALNSSLYSQQGLVARPLQHKAERKILLAWRASFPRHKAIDALRRAIQLGRWQYTTSPDNSTDSLLVENNNW
jgi:LysR family hydrogen peroxide-inducible transcriptional activator